MTAIGLTSKLPVASFVTQTGLEFTMEVAENRSSINLPSFACRGEKLLEPKYRRSAGGAEGEDAGRNRGHGTWPGGV